VQLLKALHFAENVEDLVADIGIGFVAGGFGPVEEHVGGSPVGAVSTEDVENEVVVKVDGALIKGSMQLVGGLVSSELEKVLDEGGWTRMQESWA